ncbi:PLP-dependent aminotransferase family protein [Luteolibacter marinus]|uniref:MocR-like pyridoxine biosynthesis transcription factor PdxR n=1 Tax=Luteolibacter marinus TaxID=2776705 RepID=UPI0018689363|nr:PLP-dependent aminotransferase family protein [Luteolibacter marinus]
MPKNPTWPALPLPERPDGSRISTWLHREIRAAILEGRLAAGTRLPPTRSLASQLGIARGTVSSVYEELAAEGYVAARTGDGTRVLAAGRTQLVEPVTSQHLEQDTPVRLADRASEWQRTPFPIDQSPPRAFRANIPSAMEFPLEVWSRLSSRRIRFATRGLLLESDPLGYLPLRDAIAAHLCETRGLRCGGDQVMIVSGTQMALDLTARLLIDPGDSAWVEDPGYPGASRLLTAYGARVIPVPVDGDGMNVGEAARRAPDVRLAVLTPSHQFPLGVTLSVERRTDLLRRARMNGFWIFEDDYDSEFRFTGRPLVGMQGMPGGERVLFSGSFSKMLYPGIRLGFLVLPRPLVEPFRAARSLIDRFPATLEQAVLCDFITEGHFERHLRRMRMTYMERYATLVEVSRKVWGERLAVDSNDTGLQAVAWLGEGRSAEALTGTAGYLGYEFVPLTRYTHRIRRCLGHSIRAGVQVGFAAQTPAELTAAIHAVDKIL